MIEDEGAHMSRWKALTRFRLRFLLLLVPICAAVAWWMRPPPPPADHWITDVEGAPIAGARLHFFQMDERSEALPSVSYARITTDKEGGFALRLPEEPSGIAIRITQADYGTALVRLSQFDIERGGNQRLRLPLVSPDSELLDRAVHGKVVNTDGEPVAGAEIYCPSVRTPGEGLVSPVFPNHSAMSGVDGTFRLYLPNRPLSMFSDEVARVPHGDERGQLIPLNSEYFLEVTPPSGSAYFPISLSVDNVKPATIELSQTTREHQFEFESLEGGLIVDPELRQWITVQYHQQGEQRAHVPVAREVIRDGGSLVAGEYSAEFRDSTGKTIRWDNLQVTDDSPEILRFKIPPPVVFRGRVVDGTTGEPVAGAFVGGRSGIRRQNLALITPQQWTALEAESDEVDLNGQAFAPFAEHYTFDAVVSTDEDGRFELTQPPDSEFYAMLAFARDQLPYYVRVHPLREQLEQGPEADAGTIQLFPAARLTVHPNFDLTTGQHVSLSPHWLFEEGDQPGWFSDLQKAHHEYGDRQFDYVHWMKLNEKQPILVPADVRFRIEFRTPYDDEWNPDNRSEVFQIATGDEADFGELTFSPGVKIEVRVTSPDGKPVEGAPVRRLIVRANERAWSIPHNSDADGLVHFYVPPKSAGKLAVLYHPPQGKRFEAPVQFDAEQYDPSKPLEIELTKQQVEAVKGAWRE